MAHIVLLRPPAVSSLHAYSIGLVPPLGLAYIAAALESAGHRVTAIDALGESPFNVHPAAHPALLAHGLTIDEIVARVPFDAEGVGISVMFSQQWPHVDAIVRALAQARPGVKVFIGGEHATAGWQWILDSCPAVSLCVLGEGEETAVAVADWLDGRVPLEEISGIAFRRQDEAIRAERRSRIRQMEEISRPAWHLFPIENYLSMGLNHGVSIGRSMPILATRGCPYDCTFCSSPEMWTRRYTERPVTDVVNEIESYVRTYRITNIDFEDLTMIVRRRWILDFCRELSERKLNITFQLPTGTRSEALDEEVLIALRDAGCSNLTYAPESGSPSTLVAIKKKVNLDRMIASMETAKRIGLTTRVNVIIGFPEESRRELWQTLRYCARLSLLGIEDVPLFPFTPYPGTELFDNLQREGRLPAMSNDFLAQLGYQDFTTTKSYNRFISSAELNAYRVGGMASFILIGYARRPWRLLRTVRNLLNSRSETALEQRLLEAFRRSGVGVTPVAEVAARPAENT